MSRPSGQCRNDFFIEVDETNWYPLIFILILTETQLPKVIATTRKDIVILTEEQGVTTTTCNHDCLHLVFHKLGQHLMELLLLSCVLQVHHDGGRYYLCLRVRCHHTTLAMVIPTPGISITICIDRSAMVQTC